MSLVYGMVSLTLGSMCKYQVVNKGNSKIRDPKFNCMYEFTLVFFLHLNWLVEVFFQYECRVYDRSNNSKIYTLKSN